MQAGFSQQQAEAIRGSRIDSDDKLQTLLAVAREIAADVGEVSDATFERTRNAGWNEQQLTELFAHVAVNPFTNYFNHYAQIELDIPAASGVAS